MTQEDVKKKIAERRAKAAEDMLRKADELSVLHALTPEKIAELQSLMRKFNAITGQAPKQKATHPSNPRIVGLTNPNPVAAGAKEPTAVARKSEQPLDPNMLGKSAEMLISSIHQRIIGQDVAVGEIVKAYIRHRAGLNSPGRPSAVFMLVGPTGSGKTHVVQTIAEIITGSKESLLRIDCGEYQHSHEVAKLVGAPPGYLGHRETKPLITQVALDKQHTEDSKLSFLLFDEIDKAHGAVLDLLMGVFDYGILRCGDNSTVNLEKTMIFLTANTGAKQMNEALSSKFGLGSVIEISSESAVDAAKAGEAAARKSLRPEMMNRLDKILPFHPLSPGAIRSIADIEISKLQSRMAEGTFPILLTFEESAVDRLAIEGYDPKYGARHLKRALDREIVTPVANLLVSGQIKTGAHVRVGLGEIGFLFTEL